MDLRLTVPQGIRLEILEHLIPSMPLSTPDDVLETAAKYSEFVQTGQK